MRYSKVNDTLLILLIATAIISCGRTSLADAGTPQQPLNVALISAICNSESPQEVLPRVKALLDKGADVNACEEHGSTPLMMAVVYRQPALIRLLVARGANVNIRDNGYDEEFDVANAPGKWHRPGQTALEYAADRNDLESMQFLLKHGADGNVRKRDGSTLLIRASSCNDDAKVRILLKNHVDVNAADNNGFTALMYLASWGKEALVSQLLKSGASINTQNRFGDTALLYCVEENLEAPRVVQLLLKAGADSDRKNLDGKSALDVAEKKGYRESIRILRQAKVRRNRIRESKT